MQIPQIGQSRVCDLHQSSIVYQGQKLPASLTISDEAQDQWSFYLFVAISRHLSAHDLLARVASWTLKAHPRSGRRLSKNLAGKGGRRKSLRCKYRCLPGGWKRQTRRWNRSPTFVSRLDKGAQRLNQQSSPYEILQWKFRKFVLLLWPR